MVGGILGNLKNMASDMGSEIERQNKQLDKIGTKVSSELDLVPNQSQIFSRKIIFLFSPCILEFLFSPVFQDFIARFWKLSLFLC